MLPLLPDGFDSEKLGWHFFSQVDLLRLVHCVIHENQFRTGELKNHINNAGAKLYARLLTEEPALFGDIQALIALISPVDLDDATLDASLKKLAHRELMLKKPGFHPDLQRHSAGGIRFDIVKAGELSNHLPLNMIITERLIPRLFSERLRDAELIGPYWHEWYQSFLDGKPLDWELQRQVALIDDTIWDQGPKAVADEIGRIKAEMLSEKLPMAETIEVNPETGKFRAVPIPVQNHRHMSALLNQVEDALEDCLGGHNGLRETSGDVRKLNRVLGKYREDPQNAELTLSTVAGSLRRQIHESRELPDNEDNLALLSTVEDALRGIRAEHPEVEENRLKRASLTVQELPEADKELLQSALPVLEELSDEPLGEDFGDDFGEMLSPRLLNDTVGPVPDLPAGAKPLMGEYRAFSRISKMAQLKDKIDGATASRAMRVVNATASIGGVGTLLYQLVQIGLRLFGVL